MTRQDIDTIISIICPNDEDFEKACISPAYLKNELEILALEQEPCEDAISRKSMLDYIKYLDGEMPEEEFVKALPSVTPVACIATVKFSKEDMQELVNEKMKDIVVERKKGHWIDYSDEGYVECSECGSCTNCDGNITDLHFCFSCGAEMESEE